MAARAGTIQFFFAAAVGVAIAVFGGAALLREKVDGDVSHHISAAELAALKPPADTFSPVFQPCAHCHQIGKGAKMSTGPDLNDIIDRPAAATSYPYSKALRDSGLIWNETTLRAYLANPQKMVPGTRMIFRGLEADKMNALIEFLKSESHQAGSPSK